MPTPPTSRPGRESAPRPSPASAGRSAVGDCVRLKLDLAKILAVGDRYLHPRIAVTRTSEAVTEVVSRIHQSLDGLVAQISDENLKPGRLGHRGGGTGRDLRWWWGLFHAAMESENRLFRLGLSASHCNDAQLQLMIAATLSRATC